MLDRLSQGLATFDKRSVRGPRIVPCGDQRRDQAYSSEIPRTALLPDHRLAPSPLGVGRLAWKETGGATPSGRNLLKLQIIRKRLSQKEKPLAQPVKQLWLSGLW